MRNRAAFWQSGPLPPWLLGLLGAGLALLLGLGLAAVLGISVADGAWLLSAALLIAVPVGALLIRYPLGAILLWMLLRPYLDAVPEAASGQAHWVIHRALLPAAVGAVLLSRWLGLRRWRPVRLGAPELVMVAFLGLVAVNIYLWGWEPARTYREAYDRFVIPFCAYLLVRLAAPDERDLRLLLVVALVTLVVQSLVSLLSWYVPDLLPARWTDGAVELGRTAGTLRLAAAYTATLVFGGLLIYHHALNSRSKATRYLLIPVVGLAAFFVFFSFSRGSWFGGLAVFLGLLLIYPGPTLRLALVGALVLVVAVLGLGFLADELAWGGERLSGELAEGSAEGRVVAARALAEMTSARPLRGWGYETHQYYAPRYVRPVGDLKIPRLGRVPSHNTYLTISSELGVLALLLYLFPAGWWLVQSLRVGPRLPGKGFQSWRLVALLWLVILDIAVVSGFTDLVRWDSFGTSIWWLTLGIIASLVAPYLGASESARMGRQPPLA